MGYKLEKWKEHKWKNTKREQIKTVERFVSRYPKGTIINGKNVSGRFVKEKPVIRDIKFKHNINTGYVAKVGYYKGKMITKQTIQKPQKQEWGVLKPKKQQRIYRTSYVLNDIPYRGNVYYGFRIHVFSSSKKQLENLKSKIKNRLIKFIEECLKYRKSEFWFDLYWGYESPKIVNEPSNSNQTYTLQWQKSRGGIMKTEHGNIGDL